MGKEVTYNDYLHYNHLSAVALIENSTTALTDEDLDFIFSEHPRISYGDFVAEVFRDYYFLDVDAPTAPNQPAVTATGTYAATAATSYTWNNKLY
jgi:hypothetical protein